MWARRNAVARLFDVAPHTLVAPSRGRRIVLARHAAIWVISQCWPGLSNVQIARLFGDRCRSTIYHALCNARAQRKRSRVFRVMTDALVQAGETPLEPVPADMLASLVPPPIAPPKRPARRDPLARRVSKPKNALDDDDRGARQRAAASGQLMAALRREHPDRCWPEGALTTAQARAQGWGIGG